MYWQYSTYGFVAYSLFVTWRHARLHQRHADVLDDLADHQEIVAARDVWKAAAEDYRAQLGLERRQLASIVVDSYRAAGLRPANTTPAPTSQTDNETSVA